MTWQDILNYNPLPPLLSSKNVYIEYFARRDLLGGEKKPINYIWMLDEPQKILKKQLSDGSWKSNNKNKEIYPLINYSLIETWKKFRFLIEKYEFNKTYPAIEKAAEFIFSCQTEEGDIRGFLANQYAMYYTGALMSLLIKAGYQNDSRIEKSLKWLLKMRQDDGGWVATPFQTLKLSGEKIRELTSVSKTPLKEHDKTKPFSHNWTGMILRAFAAHKKYRNSEEAKYAANLLKSRFFKADCYSSYKHPDNWLRFQFPFWWNNLVAAMDALSFFGIPAEDHEIKNAINWFRDHQESNGLWKTSYSKIHKSNEKKEEQSWISLVICRILKRFYS
jgi:hypothetical protein